MHTYKRYLMMLVALLAMTTGAWADDLSELIITDGYDTSYTGEHFTITGTACWEYGFYLSKAGPQTVTISSKNGEVITKIEMSYSYGVTYAASTTASAGTVSADGKSVTNVNATTVTIGTSAETTEIINIDVWKIYYTAAPAGTALTPDATRKVWTLDAMPAGNVELQVEYYPGMLTFVSEHGTVTVEGLSETTLPAGFEMDAEGNIYVASGTIFTLKAEPAEGYKLASWTFGGTTVPDDGTGTLNMQMSDNDAIITANFEEMTYDLTVKAANEFSEGKIESVTVAGEAAEPDADGKISGVKKGQPIILKAKEGYKFRSATVKEAAAGPKYADVVKICDTNADNRYLISSFFDGTNANITTITKEEAIALAEYLGGGDIRVVYEEHVFAGDKYVKATNAAGSDSGITLSSTNTSFFPLYYVPAGN